MRLKHEIEVGNRSIKSQERSMSKCCLCFQLPNLFLFRSLCVLGLPHFFEFVFCCPCLDYPISLVCLIVVRVWATNFLCDCFVCCPCLDYQISFCLSTCYPCQDFRIEYKKINKPFGGFRHGTHRSDSNHPS